MDWSCGETGTCKTDTESRCPESGGKKKARKTGTTTGGVHEETWTEWEENGEQQQNIAGIGDFCYRR